MTDPERPRQASAPTSAVDPPRPAWAELYVVGSQAYVCAVRPTDQPTRGPWQGRGAAMTCGVRLGFRRRPGEPSRAQAPPPGSDAPEVVLHLHMTHPAYRALRRHVLGHPGPIAEAACLALAPALDRIAWRGTAPTEVQALADEVVTTLLGRSSPSFVPLDPRLIEAMALLERDVDCGFDAVRSRLGLSASGLSHLFSRGMGHSFRRCVLWVRTMLAWELVAFEPALRVTDIAHRMGFADSAHMSRAFQRFFGAPPLQFRDPAIFRLHGRAAPPGERMFSALPAQDSTEPSSIRHAGD